MFEYIVFRIRLNIQTDPVSMKWLPNGKTQPRVEHPALKHPNGSRMTIDEERVVFQNQRRDLDSLSVWHLTKKYAHLRKSKLRIKVNIWLSRLIII